MVFMHFLTSYTPEFRPQLLEMTERVAKAGVEVIQFSYAYGADGHILEMAQRVKEITDKYSTKLCVNNRIDIANIIGADYVHIGQRDVPIEVARRYLDREIQIGLTVTATEELNPLADYYGVGPIFKTVTQDSFNKPIGLEALRDIAEHTDKPIVAIGGITSNNYLEILNAGATDVAVIGDIYRSSDVAQTIQKYRRSCR